MRFYFENDNNNINIVPNIRLMVDSYWNYATDIKKYYLIFTFTWLKFYFEIDFRKKS